MSREGAGARGMVSAAQAESAVGSRPSKMGVKPGGLREEARQGRGPESMVRPGSRLGTELSGRRM